MRSSSRLHQQDVETAVTTAASSGDYSNLPDIVLFQDHYIQRYVADYPDAWTPLGDVDINWDDFAAEKLDYSTIDGEHYGVPVDNGTVVAHTVQTFWSRQDTQSMT